MDDAVGCPSCAAPNRPGRRFCAQCGVPLDASCARCGARNEPGERFCGDCGSPLDPAPLASAHGTTAHRAPTVERRIVSVLFADLVGFTTLSEARDAEEVRELLGRYFDAARAIIERYGGVVEKFIGDAVMAVWGTPTAREDDPERAVRAALDLVGEVAAVGAAAGAPALRARAGVVTGMAAATVGAVGQGMVAGDVVNTAARVQGVAAPGAVLVDEATRRVTEAAIAYSDAGEHALKGKAGPVRLWQAGRVAANVGGAQRPDGLEASFIGRDRELRLVRELLHECMSQGNARLVAVSGVAGIGKSRLAWEFEKYVDGLHETVWWHVGRCLSYGEGVAYWALAEMVRRRFEIVDAEPAESALRKITVGLERHVRDPEERRWLQPRLAHLLGVGAAGEPGREDLFPAWRLLIERLAQQQPVVLVFEDLQHADAGLLEFIDYLLDWSHAYPIFVLTLARPDLAERRPGFGSGRHCTPLYLEPQPSPAVGELLDELVPGLPEELRGRLVERAEGVPLYAVETVRMLLDREMLVPAPGGYQLVREVDEIDVPTTLHALVAARLDGLPADERRLVRDASVLGATFSREALQAVAGISPETLDPLLGALLRKEVFGVRSDPRSPERGQYTFVQGLVRTVAYETLSKRGRKARHLAAAQQLLDSWSETAEIAEVVAAHYLEAYRSAPGDPDAEDIRRRALTEMVRAARRAASLAAPDEARRWYEQAAELADDELAAAELIEQAGVAAAQSGLVQCALDHFAAAHTTYRQRNRAHDAARVSSRVGDLEVLHGDPERALAEMESSYAVLSAEQPDADLALLAAQLARSLLFVGRLDGALQRVDEALWIAQSLNLVEPLCQALVTKSAVLAARGRPAEGRALLKHSLETARRHDLTAVALRAANNVAYDLCMWDEPGARQASEEGLALARRVGDRLWEEAFLGSLSTNLLFTGDWDECLALSESSVPGAVSTERTGDVAIIYVLRGDTVRGLERVDRLRSFSGSSDLAVRAATVAVQAAIHLQTGDAAAALARGREAVTLSIGGLGLHDFAPRIAWPVAVEAAVAAGVLPDADALLDELGHRPVGHIPPYLRAQLDRGRALVAAARGQHDDVEPGLVAAAAQLRDLGYPFWLGRTLLDHAEWLTARGRADAAAPLLAEGAGAFERLGAQPWLARTRALASVGERHVRS